MHLAILCERLHLHDDVGDQARLLAEQWAQMGHRVTLLSATGLDAAPQEGIHIRTFGRRWWRTSLGLIAFRRWIKSNLTQIKPDYTIALTTLVPADIIIPTAGTAAAYANAIRSLRAPTPVRINARLHAIYPAILLRKHWERQALTASTLKAIVADNDMIDAQLRAIKAIDTARIVRVDPAVSAEVIQPAQAQQLRQRLARALNLNDDAAWLVFPFRLAWLDGFEPLMLAFKALIDRGVEAQLLLAGTCRYTHLMWVAQLGLRDRVRFLGRPDDPSMLIAAADLLVQPTSHDPAGAWPLAALAMGRPVLTTSASGAAPRVREQGGQVLAPTIEPGKLADAMANAIESRTAARLSDTATHAPPAGDFSPGPRAHAILALIHADPPANPATQAHRP